jgi:hypothetical protein
MPAIQAMRSNALALRAKEDMQEKIPQFYNSVNQSLGQSIVQGQDAAEQLIQSRYEAANKIAAELRQKLDGKSGLVELGVGMTMKTISQLLTVTLTLLGKTSTQKIIDLALTLTNFFLEQAALKEQFKSAVATYGQWTVQAGYTGHDSTGGLLDLANTQRSMGGRGAIKYRDAITPRWTDRRGYTGTAPYGATAGVGGVNGYDTWYSWGSVGSITRIGQT